MKTLNQVTSVLKNYKVELAKKYNVCEIGIFGSYARGEQKRKSDIDVLVDFNKPISLLRLVNLENYLKDLLNEKRIEVVPKKDIRNELKERILKEVILV